MIEFPLEGLADIVVVFTSESEGTGDVAILVEVKLRTGCFNFSYKLVYGICYIEESVFVAEDVIRTVELG